MKALPRRPVTLGGCRQTLRQRRVGPMEFCRLLHADDNQRAHGGGKLAGSSRRGASVPTIIFPFDSRYRPCSQPKKRAPIGGCGDHRDGIGRCRSSASNSSSAHHYRDEKRHVSATISAFGLRATEPDQGWRREICPRIFLFLRTNRKIPSHLQRLSQSSEGRLNLAERKITGLKVRHLITPALLKCSIKASHMPTFRRLGFDEKGRSDANSLALTLKNGTLRCGQADLP